MATVIAAGRATGTAVGQRDSDTAARVERMQTWAHDNVVPQGRCPLGARSSAIPDFFAVLNMVRRVARELRGRSRTTAGLAIAVAEVRTAVVNAVA